MYGLLVLLNRQLNYLYSKILSNFLFYSSSEIILLDDLIMFQTELKPVRFKPVLEANL